MLDKKKCQEIRTAMEAALTAVDLPGITCKVGNGTFTDNVVTFKVECGVAGASKAGEDFKNVSWKYGIEQDALGRDIMVGGVKYKIVGAKPRSRKYPILVESDQGIFKMPVATVREALKEG